MSSVQSVVNWNVRPRHQPSTRQVNGRGGFRSRFNRLSVSTGRQSRSGACFAGWFSASPLVITVRLLSFVRQWLLASLALAPLLAVSREPISVVQSPHASPAQKLAVDELISRLPRIYPDEQLVPHERSIRAFHMDADGLRVGEPLRNFRGILTGVPVPLGAVPVEPDGFAGTEPSARA